MYLCSLKEILHSFFYPTFTFMDCKFLFCRQKKVRCSLKGGYGLYRLVSTVDLISTWNSESCIEIYTYIIQLIIRVCPEVILVLILVLFEDLLAEFKKCIDFIYILSLIHPNFYYNLVKLLSAF